ncbi:hypothetical protein AVEN_188002-1 [Araneus ventricosus]|uniref:Uncharacterized protein n=1 Tax=Araneus ventricosus TaxID=182803 RepID=A0A4Y2J4Q8_ARAVE|nr:hypothetical protein AVEN_188002-1 [Araneus ventricosus]
MTSEDSENYPGCNSAQKKLLRIPPRLRKRVLEAIHGLKTRVALWRRDHSSIMKLDAGERIFCFRCDGTIDTVKTAQQLVLNSNIDIRKRFYLACIYCIEDGIKTLWAEIEATGKTGNIENAVYWVVRFWVRWLRDRSLVLWKEAALGYCGISGDIRFYPFFPSLRPEERKIFLTGFIIATNDDLLLCLKVMTKEEEEEILRRYPHKVLLNYLHWPLRSLFLETAEKIWKYFDETKYRSLLTGLLNSKINREVYDFDDFFECFWNSSPEHLRESVKELPYLGEQIESCFNEIRRKRKADFDELKHQKIKKSSRDINETRRI